MGNRAGSSPVKGRKVSKTGFLKIRKPVFVCQKAIIYKTDKMVAHLMLKHRAAHTIIVSMEY